MNQRSRSFSTAVLLTMALLMVSYQRTPIVHASSLATVGIWSEAYNSPDIADPSIQPGTTVIVDINVTDAPPFNGYDLTMYWDPAYLQIQFVNIRGGAFPNPFVGAEDISSGQIRLAVVNIGNPFTGGNGVLAQIQFNVTGRGVSPLTLAAATTEPSRQAQSSTQLVFGYSEIAATTEDGYFSNVSGSLGPIASFTFSPDAPRAGDTITFNASESVDPDNSGAPNRGIESYNWDFGDGFFENSSTPVITYTYEFGGYPYTPFSGNFSARLTVVDSNSNFEGMITETVQVSPICPPGLVSIEVPQDCPTIQAAVESVAPGGTIRVSPGTYIEKPEIQKPLTLTGSGNSTILEGLIQVQAPNVTVSGFRIVSNPFELGTGIELSEAPGATVRNNFIIGQRDPLNGETALFHGITVSQSASVSIENNTVENELYGVSLQFSPHALVQNNTLANNNYNLDVSGSYLQDIGESNLLDGRPSFYGTAVNSSQIPSNAGYVGIVNSHDLRIGPLSTANIGQGITVFNSTRITVDRLEAANVTVGVNIHNSTAITVTNSKIANFNPVLGCTDAILDFTTQSLIANNSFTFPCGSGILLFASTLNTMQQNVVGGDTGTQAIDTGIEAFDSPTNYYLQNQIVGDFALKASANNTLVDNEISGSLSINNSPNNALTGNRIIANPFYSPIKVSSEHPECLQSLLSCGQLADYVQYFGLSNTVDGRGVYYLVNESNVSVPSNAGFVAIVESTNVLFQQDSPATSSDVLVIGSKSVTIRGVNFSHEGVFAWHDQNLTIANNVFSTYSSIVVESSSIGKLIGNTLSGIGEIELANSTRFRIVGNMIHGSNRNGILLLGSSNNTLLRNTIFGDAAGIWIYDLGSTRQSPLGNLIVGNTLARNEFGLIAGTDDTIYQNDFIGNAIQAKAGPGDLWNSPAGQGNYWSDYTGQDTNHDGIGDTMLPHLGLDNYPLMFPWFPSGLAAKLTMRAAWPEFRRISIAKQGSSTQTLFALANNTGTAPEWVEAVFNITSSNGSTFQLVAQPVWTNPGGQTSFSVHFSAVPGSYKVAVTIKYSSDGYMKWVIGNSKTFSFQVVS